MIDLRELRKDPEAFWESLKGKQRLMTREEFDRLVQLDREYLQVQKLVEERRAEKNYISRRLATLEEFQYEYEERIEKTIDEIEEKVEERRQTIEEHEKEREA